MPGNAKIATCCYCGTRTVLTLRGTVRHELSCAACGAPLRAMKRLREPEARTASPRPLRSAEAHPARQKPRKRKRMRKPVWRKALEEAFDALDDIFD